MPTPTPLTLGTIARSGYTLKAWETEEHYAALCVSRGGRPAWLFAPGAWERGEPYTLHRAAMSEPRQREGGGWFNAVLVTPGKLKLCRRLWLDQVPAALMHRLAHMAKSVGDRPQIGDLLLSRYLKARAKKRGAK